MLHDLVDEKNDWKINEQTTTTRQAIPETEVELIHKVIQREITYCLLSSNVQGRSVYNEFGGIDILVDDWSHFILIEIKTGFNIRAIIREAIGQLLEYQYSNRVKIEGKRNYLLIVSPAAADNEAADYIKHLRKKYKVDLAYKQYVPGSFSFVI
mgnify:CR=1 FL=1